jgi:hypothetical protein
MQGEYALYIDGRFITGGGRLTEPVFDPATSEALDYEVRPHPMTPPPG